MTTKSFFIVAVISFISMTSLFGQTTKTVYYLFDSNWQPTKSEYYTYYRKVELNSKGQYVGNIVDYYRNGNVQCIINANSYDLDCGSSFQSCSSGSGEITWFNQNGQAAKYEKYVNGKLVQRLVPEQRSDDWTFQDVVEVADMALTAYEIYKLLTK